HGYRRLAFSALSRHDQERTLQNLAVLMGLINWDGKSWYDNNNEPINLTRYLLDNQQSILDSTLIRKYEHHLFAPSKLLIHNSVYRNGAGDGELELSIPVRKRPDAVPDNWTILDNDGKVCRIEAAGGIEVLVRDYFKSPVNSAGQLPTGFAPNALYPSRSHPR